MDGHAAGRGDACRCGECGEFRARYGRAVGRAFAAYQFATAFPRRTFADEERGATLRDLGLVPNAALDASAK